MPKIGEMIPSKFLKKEDVGRGVLGTITRVERVNVAVEGSDPEYKWAMYFKELDKPLILNVTNIHACADTFGSDDTDEWLNKSIVLYDDPNVAFAGKRTGGIRLRAPKPGAVKDQQAEAEAEKPAFDDDIPF